MLRLSMCGALLFGAASSAQEMPQVKPGPEHEVLKGMAGTWTGKMKMQGQESDCRMVHRMECGGLWLTSNFTTKFGDMNFQGKGFDSYDPASKKYVGVWVDSVATKPMTIEGAYDAATKTMTAIGVGPGPDGKEVKHTMVTKMVDKDTMTFKMSMGEQEMFTIEYKRSADQSKGKRGRGEKKPDAPPPAK